MVSIKKNFNTAVLAVVTMYSFLAAAKCDIPADHHPSNIIKTFGDFADVQPYTYDSKRVLLVVYVHGTVVPSLTPDVLFRASRKAYKEQIAYADAIDYTLRYHSFSVEQPAGPRGLCPFITAPQVPKHAQMKREHFGKITADMWQTAFGGMYKNVETASYGWDGRLSHKNRMKAAGLMYDALLLRKKQLARKHGVSRGAVDIIIVGHSHGGNVPLLLGAHKSKGPLVIKSLITFGMPVQSESSGYAHDPMFQSVINVFSKGDLVQILDFVSTRDDSSRRRIIYGPDNKTISQFQIDCEGIRPNHSELWFWNGRRTLFYRNYLTIHPWPVAIFAPYIAWYVFNKRAFGDYHITFEREDAGHPYHLRFSKARDRVTPHDIVCIKNKHLMIESDDPFLSS